ncbi:hypothetical protein AVEN_208703-1 [Araneus ventricosus]|uniref:Uncharacterized protein n=1 Tax=Araneus ventricosus TaxID=182803 RepID=A0A4Y2FHT2_ARAVE|nr:hypothetical protein AVEN_208703-1 [Araneus ventricosus]
MWVRIALQPPPRMRLSGLWKWTHITPPITPLLNCGGTIVNEVLEEAEQSCKEVRKRKKKRFFDKKCEDESSEIFQHKKFKLALLQVNDRIEAELERRFQSMQKVNEIFGFLSPKQLTTLDNKTLREKASTLRNLYRDDLDKDELSVEIESFKYTVVSSDNLAGNESKKSKLNSTALDF